VGKEGWGGERERESSWKQAKNPEEEQDRKADLCAGPTDLKAWGGGASTAGGARRRERVAE
jgi:hypothetical protein